MNPEAAVTYPSQRMSVEMNRTKSTILIVEDEKDIIDLMSLHLKREGYSVRTVNNGEEALRILEEVPSIKLLLLDWMLPGLSGLDLCKKIRSERKASFSSIPILMITARTHTSDIVLGLEMGADDYLTKPFEIPVFLARVHAQLRRSMPETHISGQEKKHSIGGILIDEEAFKVFCKGEEVQLTPSEFKLLTALVTNSGRVLTRDRLIELVKGEGIFVVDRAIDTHIFGLRKKLGKCASIVETVRGIGYRVQS